MVQQPRYGSALDHFVDNWNGKARKSKKESCHFSGRAIREVVTKPTLAVTEVSHVMSCHVMSNVHHVSDQNSVLTGSDCKLGCYPARMLIL